MAGADIDTQDKYGRTALHIAALIGRVSIARFFLLNNTKWEATPLRDALKNETWDTAVRLVGYGADLSNEKGLNQLLFAAAERGSTQACERLIEAGAGIGLKDAYGRSPYELAK